MEIRKANVLDFERFYELKSVYNKEMLIEEKSKEFVLNEFKEYLNKIFFVAVDNKILLGYIFAEIEENPYEKIGYISEIFVTNNNRGKGISSMLKDKVIENMKEQKITKVRLDVNTHNPAVDAYKKWGFKIDKYRMSLEIE